MPMSFFERKKEERRLAKVRKESAERDKERLAGDSILIQGYLDREAATLTSAGVPVPVQHGPFTSETDPTSKGSIPHPYIALPKFTLPPHLVFRVSRIDREDGRHISYPPEMSPAQTYFITGDAATIERAQQDFAEYSLPTIVEDYPGHWFNRDPYGLYKLFNTDFKGFRFHSPLPQTWYELLPLEIIRGLTADEVDLVRRRHDFFGFLIGPAAAETWRLTKPAVLFIEPSSNDPVFTRLPLPDSVLPELSYFKIIPSPDTHPATMRQFLDSLRTTARPILFEIIAHEGTIYFQMSCAPRDESLIQDQLQLHFREFTILPLSGSDLPELPELHFFCAWPAFAYDSFKVSNDFAIDPYQQLFTILAAGASEDYISVLFSFAPIDNAAVRMITEHITHPNFTEVMRLLEKKQPLWFAGLSVFASNPTVLEQIKAKFMKQYETPGQRWNILGTVVVEEKEESDSRGLVSTSELAALVHFPDKTVDCELLETASMKSKLPPALYTASGIPIGQSEARGQTKTVTLSESIRDRHVYLVGKSGTGKSTILLNAAVADIQAGRGLAVIDPHGDLAEGLLDRIPAERIQDTIYADFRDKEHPIALNILDAQSEDEIDLLAEDLLITFKRTTDSWGDKMHAILLNTFHTLLRAPGATFVDITTLITNQAFRERILAQINNPQLSNYWEHEFTGYAREAQPILTRMHKFTLNSSLYTILSQAQSSLNFYDIIDEQKIFLANISKGKLGTDTSKLLGSILVSQIQLAAMRQAALPQEFRKSFYLYVDEFQNFTSSAFETILSEARKYKLCLTLAHQFIGQLDAETRGAIFGNVGTKILFSLSPQDAQVVHYELGSFEAQDLINLPNFSALCVPATSAKDTFSFKSFPPPKNLEPSNRPAVIEHTRTQYASRPQAPAPPPEATPRAAGPGPDPEPLAARPARKAPAPALPIEFASVQDKVLHFVQVAEYLSTPQIIQLCNLQPSNASTNLAALIKAGRLKEYPNQRPKIYHVGKSCNPTQHNLSIRDLFVKIQTSGYEIAEVKFTLTLGNLNPDLAVDFLAEDQSLIKTFWEYDTGTEPHSELLKKVERYLPHSKDSLITFVFDTQRRLDQVAKSIPAPYVTYAVLTDFQTLNDAAFRSASGGQAQRAFFP